MANKLNKNNVLIILAILVVGAFFISGRDVGCTNTCATDFNQRPSPNCECYADRDNDEIPDVIDPEPDVPFVPVEEGDDGFIDSDGDGWADEDELSWGSDPNNPDEFPYQDSDGDGFLDIEEISWGTDPFDPNDFPVLEEETTEPEAPITPPPEEPPFMGCLDNDGILNLESQIITGSSCQDAEGIHFDECLINSDTISEWQCENSMCKRTNLDCVDWLGIGSACVTGNDICTTPITYTSSQCETLRIENNREFKGLVENQDACDERVFFVCDLRGQTGGMTNWFPSNCCVYDCMDI